MTMEFHQLLLLAKFAGLWARLMQLFPKEIRMWVGRQHYPRWMRWERG